MRRYSKVTVDIFFDFSNPYSYIGIKVFRFARKMFKKSNPDINLVTQYHSTPTLPMFQNVLLISQLQKEFPDEFSDIPSLKNVGKSFGCPMQTWTYHANSFPAFLLFKAANQKIKENIMDDIFNDVFERGENIADYNTLNVLVEKYQVKEWNWNTIQHVIGQYDVSKKHYLIKDYPKFVFNGKVTLSGMLINVNAFFDAFRKCI